jgi:serine/threonine protein kinase
VLSKIHRPGVEFYDPNQDNVFSLIERVIYPGGEKRIGADSSVFKGRALQPSRIRMDVRPGSRLGAYDVAASIGRGGMGEVYRAPDSKLHRDVANRGAESPVHRSVRVDRSSALRRDA